VSTVISVENVSKAYRLGMIGGGTLKDDVARWWAKARRKPDPLAKIGEEHHAGKVGDEFWALDQVSFEVDEGEVLGIIGRNGAGKSTLLKILSQVTAPTSGEIKIKGRIASLLEVGTGFHPELTGRENTFLNGAILGMTKAEIRRKFDEIVAFSGIEDFIDTPVKRYSSGMYVRLAFAVAAHLESEILIVDEVLAVGDVQFQKKCLGKMNEVAHGGRTVLFVSHNMSAMRGLCTRGLTLKNGSTVCDADIESAIDNYLSEDSSAQGAMQWKADELPQNGKISFRGACLLDERNQPAAAFECRSGFYICLEYEVQKPITNLRIGFFMRNAVGVEICGSNDEEQSHGSTTNPGIYTTLCRFPPHVLNVGRYALYFGADAPNGGMEPLLTDYCVSFAIEDNAGHGPGHLTLPGIIRPKLHWSKTTVEVHESRALFAQ
jgi:lipopolysaccharide transport system ATP-binding protein